MVTLTYQERFKTERGVFDSFTERNLFELQSRGYFDELTSPYKVGKESNVFLAKKGKGMVIVKIYRVQNCDFKRMFNYIKQDPRYDYLKNRRREIIFAWAQREYKNLIKAQQTKVNSPTPYVWKYNILVEEMIGEEEPALPLKDCPAKNPQKFFLKVIEGVQKMYNQGLIHGDLSSFNILNFKEKPYFIDFSQATLVKTPNSLELLQRDIKNVVQYFRTQGVKAEAEEIYQSIVRDTY